MPEADPPPADLHGLSLDAIAARAGATRTAPVENWNPPFCGDSGIRIAADGRWIHAGTPIERPAMVRLFATVLRRDPEGYRLVTPAEKLAITVDDLPFLAVECRSEGEGPARRLAFRLATGDLVVAGPDHPLRWEDGRPAVTVRGGLAARIARPVYYELAAWALDEAVDPPGLWSNGAFFPLGDA
jgi:hypothetical protein